MLLRLGLALLLGCLTSGIEAASWKAGTAKANITPDGYMWMAGYASRTRPADSKLTDLWAKALVLEDATGQQAVLITLDIIGVDRELGLSARKQVAARHRLDLSQVMLSTSHTHSGPVVGRNLRPMHYLTLDKTQRKLVDAYADKLETAIVEVVAEARKKLAPCELHQASGRAAFAANRRNNPEAEILKLKEANAVRGPSDHDVPVLAVKDASGKWLAIVFGYACHATVLDSYGWCGDYPAYAQLAVEKLHPEALAMFWAGCGGDQNPLPRRKLEHAQNYGAQLGEAVERALVGETLKPVAGKLRAQYVEIDLPLARLPTSDELAAQAASPDRYIASRARYWQAELAAGRAMPASYPYPIGRWQIGDDIEWLFLGGEVVVDYALRFKAASRDKQTWVAAYANDVMAYIPSRRVLTEGGYEGGGAMIYYGLPAPWAETVEADIAAAVKQLQDQK